MHATNDQSLPEPVSQANTAPDPGSAGRGSDAEKQWTDHEHQAGRAHIQAQKLIEETGSPELAKHAIDGTTDHHHSEPAEDDGGERTEFAQRLGFDSYRALEAMSTPVLSENGQLRMVGSLPGGKWIIWKRGSWNWHQEFDTWQQVRDALATRTD